LDNKINNFSAVDSFENCLYVWPVTVHEERACSWELDAAKWELDREKRVGDDDANSGKQQSATSGINLCNCLGQYTPFAVFSAHGRQVNAGSATDK